MNCYCHLPLIAPYILIGKPTYRDTLPLLQSNGERI